MKKNPILNAKPLDPRPQFNLWAPGDYMSTCFKCGCIFLGDKRAQNCADCAYGCTVEECAESVWSKPKVGIDTEEIYITRKEYEKLLADQAMLETILKATTQLISGPESKIEPDLTTCPNCGGPADNGFNRYVPPEPYWCTKCEARATRNMKNDENE